MNKGKAVQIIDVNPKEKTLNLNEEALKDILSRVDEDMPISIVSVVGKFRSGKSFLLNFFLQYLKKAENETDITNLKDWLKTEDIIGGNSSNNSYSEKDGFGWKRSKIFDLSSQRDMYCSVKGDLTYKIK
eukprot:snap_masked-scaffold_102-processed-gene-0.20-mRNA-1 protein AED:0.26 eAED:0.26 QI:0/0/0/0.33/1/1/3/0/129